MMRLSKPIKVVRLPDGKYIKSFQYSQGYEDVIKCDYPWEAEDFNENGNLILVIAFYPDSTIIEGNVQFISKSK